MNRLSPLPTAGSFSRSAPFRIVVVAALVFAIGVALAVLPTARASAQTYTPVMPTPTRIAGADRYQTAIAVAQKLYPTTAPIVLIATGQNFPDALAAAPVAAKLGGPLLLTATDSLPQEVGAELTSLDPSTVVIVGGEGAVSPAVVSEISAAVPTATITPISGADRYATAQALIDYAFPNGAPNVYLATGANFPDALDAAATAGALGEPLILVNGSASSINAETVDFMHNLGVRGAVVAGGGGSVSTSIVNQINQLGLLQGEPSGLDRYQTADAIAATAFGAIGSNALLATGAQFPDALSAATLAAATDTPLYLSTPTCVPEDTYDSIQIVTPTAVTLVGGTGALSQGVANYSQCATTPFDVPENVDLQSTNTNSSYYSSSCVPGDKAFWLFLPVHGLALAGNELFPWTYRASGPDLIVYHCAN
jgi:putative cell wall-binding protein